MNELDNKNNKWYNTNGAQFFLVMCIVMILVMGVVGVLLTIRSVGKMRAELCDHMASVAETAASLVDGDEVEKITEADAPIIDEETGHRVQNGSERCSRIERTLLQVKNAQKETHVPYIYITRYTNGHQVFIIDPDPDAPAEYGQEVVATPAQALAWAGQTKVDDEPY